MDPWIWVGTAVHEIQLRRMLEGKTIDVLKRQASLMVVEEWSQVTEQVHALPRPYCIVVVGIDVE